VKTSGLATFLLFIGTKILGLQVFTQEVSGSNLGRGRAGFTKTVVVIT
jgi:hypothetical protein